MVRARAQSIRTVDSPQPHVHNGRRLAHAPAERCVKGTRGLTRERCSAMGQRDRCAGVLMSVAVVGLEQERTQDQKVERPL